jgi:hypothetical protein
MVTTIGNFTASNTSDNARKHEAADLTLVKYPG